MWDTTWSESYTKIIEFLKTKWRVLSEHVNNTYKNPKKYNISNDMKQVFSAHKEYLDRSDVVVAEVSWPSHGTGWELCYSEYIKRIPILALHKSNLKVSAFISWNPYIQLESYTTINECKKIIKKFFDWLLT